MKKFLVFLVSLVVVVCVGLTTYYFMRNNEIITIKTKEIYCNAGDTIPLASLGINIEKANVSKKTTFDYNAGGDDVTKYIKYDATFDAFVVSQENAGDVTLVISTSNKKYSDFTINVHIGNGTQENPYYIFNESELLRIGSTYRLDSSYVLMSDITLTSEFKPIGYNSNTETWESFNGTFDGNGHTIKGLNLNDVDGLNVGFFSTLGANAKVSNLTIENATISGSYENAGVLAGVVNGDVEKVVVKNSTITNSANQSFNGSVAGRLYGDMKLSYADNVRINLNGTEEQSLNDVTAGGLVGCAVEATIQACYTNNVELNISSVSGVRAGGFVGEFMIGTETGSIQQSYSNTICSNEYFGAFIGHIVPSSNFDIEKANMLRHLIGNVTVVYGVESSDQITDGQLVHGVIENFFMNSTYVDHSAFYDKTAALYLIRGFASVGEVISTNEFVYYAIDMNTITSWDTTYVWNVSNNSLPTLRMGNIYPASPSGEYFRRNLAQKDLGNKDTFIYTFRTDVEDQNIKILDDIDLSNGWTPVAIKNTTIDGNNKTITINLNNAVGGQLGLFTTIDNSTIKNLNIVVTGVSANATNAGALAGSIISSDELTTSSVENVTISYQGFATPVITNFGGIAGNIENTVISNCSVSSLEINNNASIANAAGLVAVNNGTIKSCEVSATISATTNAGGVVALNAGEVLSVTGNVNVNITATSTNANIGGVVANNTNTIDDITLTANINVNKTTDNQNIGGVAGVNDGQISNVTLDGDSISINENNENVLFVGGIVGINNGEIENVVNNIKEVGTYYVGKNHYVGGVVVINSGTISKVVSQSNLAGNYVSGVVSRMNSSAVIDQVVVGKFDATSRTLSQNEFRGDKYITGIVLNFNAGTITNAQVSSKLVGETNSTRSSLVALIFPYGATLKNATVDSSFSGYGIRYREVWTDFASYTNKSEFGLSNGETGDARYNIYKYDTYHGCMQSVVINSANEGVDGATASMGSAFAWTQDYQDTADSSFVKVVNGFYDISQFQGSFTFTCCVSSLFQIKKEATKTLTFSIGDVWESNNGISLMFLNDLIEIPQVIE